VDKGWNFADIWEAIARDAPNELAFLHDGVRRTWGEFEARSSSLASAMLATGIPRQSKVAIYMYNRPEYAETFAAAAKAAFVPVNTNYRYLDQELIYIWTNSDANIVAYDSRFDERVAAVREHVPAVTLWLRVDDAGYGPCPDWATPYEEAATSSAGAFTPAWPRSGDDLFFVFTGGTTGFPKAVMWTQHDFVMAMLGSVFGGADFPDQPDMARLVPPALPRPVGSPACPFMHGTGISMLLLTMMQGGTVATSAPSSFRAADLFDLIQDARVSQIAIVGDAFGRPMRDALNAEPRRWDLTSLKLIFSAGVMLSREIKQTLFSHLPGVTIADVFGSSESVGVASVVARAGDTVETARFVLGPKARVLDEADRDIIAGSGEIGKVAVAGHQPVGYYKDPEASARAFRVIDGVRYSIPGDLATVESDGSIMLLGRGSSCINTGGEKVFPEEVEEALKIHQAVDDAAVVGIPDDRFGESVVAFVQAAADHTPDPAELIAHVKTLLASYKAPRRVFTVDDVGRSVAGKLDYPSLKQKAQEFTSS
jgi:3-oxocholest-4-en-26-oate---CoA ligase